jgi:tetratricopeptide (TPR) repeat protein
MKWSALIALLISSQLGFAQTLEQTFNLAIEQQNSRNFKSAISTYERVIFFDNEKSYTQQAYYNIADCHLSLNEPNKQLKALDKAIVFAANDTLANDIALEKTFYLLLNKYWKKALQELYSIEPLTKDQKRLHHYYLGAVLYATDDFVRSEFHFQKLVIETEDSLRIAEIFKKSKSKLNPKRAAWAKRISFFIPGSGQIASGNIKGGINSIVLLGGLGYLYINTVENYGLLSGMITVLPWLSRYHIGGAENAEESMLTRQEKLKSKYFDELVDIVR